MTWRKGESLEPTRCNQCSRLGAFYCRDVDEYLCDECLPFALEMKEREEHELESQIQVTARLAG